MTANNDKVEQDLIKLRLFASMEQSKKEVLRTGQKSTLDLKLKRTKPFKQVVSHLEKKWLGIYNLTKRLVIYFINAVGDQCFINLDTEDSVADTISLHPSYSSSISTSQEILLYYYFQAVSGEWTAAATMQNHSAQQQQHLSSCESIRIDHEQLHTDNICNSNKANTDDMDATLQDFLSSIECFDDSNAANDLNGARGDSQSTCAAPTVPPVTSLVTDSVAGIFLDELFFSDFTTATDSNAVFVGKPNGQQAPSPSHCQPQSGPLSIGLPLPLSHRQPSPGSDVAADTHLSPRVDSKAGLGSSLLEVVVPSGDAYIGLSSNGETSQDSFLNIYSSGASSGEDDLIKRPRRKPHLKRITPYVVSFSGYFGASTTNNNYSHSNMK